MCPIHGISVESEFCGHRDCENSAKPVARMGGLSEIGDGVGDRARQKIAGRLCGSGGLGAGAGASMHQRSAPDRFRDVQHGALARRMHRRHDRDQTALFGVHFAADRRATFDDAGGRGPSIFRSEIRLRDGDSTLRFRAAESAIRAMDRGIKGIFVGGSGDPGDTHEREHGSGFGNDGGLAATLDETKPVEYISDWQSGAISNLAFACPFLRRRPIGRNELLCWTSRCSFDGSRYSVGKTS